MFDSRFHDEARRRGRRFFAGAAGATAVAALAALATLVCVAAAGGTAAFAQPAAPVTTDAVLRQSFTQTVPIIGRLVAKQAGAATTRIAGTVDAMRVQVGARVARGQTLATLGPAVLELRLKLARARHAEETAKLKTANAQLQLARQEVGRLSGLTDSAAVSRAVYDDAKQRRSIASARAEEAAAAVAGSAAEVRLAELDLSYADIKAPFDGTVTEILTEVGSFLQRGQAVARLVSERRLELEADIPAERLSGIIGDGGGDGDSDSDGVAGAQVEMRLDNGSVHRATARAVVPEENPRTRTRRVRFHVAFGRGAGPLADGQSATVLVPAGARRDIVSVHKDAVVQRGRDAIVFVVEDGLAVVRRIRTGQSSGDRFEVLDGLAPGDMTVVRGNERLQPNQPVAVSNPTGAATATGAATPAESTLPASATAAAAATDESPPTESTQ
ncbi:MAG: efflux RND transporter periplasmic adaptor subunit [Gammaproteobacteria bacterium]|nr:efflux RND transporter periplasmic adaptor subunit [Gammaproteobacteria bacterium]